MEALNCSGSEVLERHLDTLHIVSTRQFSHEVGILQVIPKNPNSHSAAAIVPTYILKGLEPSNVNELQVSDKRTLRHALSTWPKGEGMSVSLLHKIPRELRHLSDGEIDVAHLKEDTIISEGSYQLPLSSSSR